MKIRTLFFLFQLCMLCFSYSLFAGNQEAERISSHNVVTAVADAGPDRTLTCTTSEVTLGGENTSEGPEFDYEWTGPNGNNVGNDAEIEVYDSGAYILKVTNTNTSFVDMDTTNVLEDFEFPEFTINNSVLNCDNPTVLLEAIPLGNPSVNASFQWYNANGSPISTEEDIEVNEEGIYELLVTNLDNGCTSTSSAFVAADFEEPLVDIAPPSILTCENSSTTLVGSSSNPFASFEWTNSAAEVISNAPDAIVDEPDTYTLTIVNADNGCSSSASVDVNTDIEIPDVSISAPSILTCENSSATLVGSSSDSVAISYEWTTTDGNIGSGTNTLEATVNQPGTYTLIVTDNINGCTNSASVTIDTDIDVPDVSISSFKSVQVLKRQKKSLS